jgi:membrane fusion protein, multidrug efflux system
MTNQVLKTNLTERFRIKPPSKKGRICILIIVIIAVVVFGISWYIQLTTTVTTDNAKVSADLLSISAEVSGRLIEAGVQEGDTVKEGQVLAKIDDSQYQINASQAEAIWEQSKLAVAKLPNDILSAQMNVDKAKSALSAAEAQAAISGTTAKDCKRVLDNTMALYQEGAVSKETLDTCQSKYDSALMSLEVARANVSSAQDSVTAAVAQLDSLENSGSSTYEAQTKQTKATYDNAQLSLAKTIIKTPINGIVVKVAAIVGQNVSQGTSLFTIVNPEHIWITANIEERKVGRINVGDEVNITVDAYPNIVFKGHVEEIGGATQSSFSILPTENTSGNFTKVAQRLPVKISVDQQDGKLKPGMSVNVTIKIK